MTGERIVDYLVVITLIIIAALLALSMGFNLINVFQNLTSYVQ